MNRSQKNELAYQKLEDRLCLTVAVSVHHGSMVVHGDADGFVDRIEQAGCLVAHMGDLDAAVGGRNLGEFNDFLGLCVVRRDI